MCHAFYHSTNFYHQLLLLDQQLAEIVQQNGCSCGGKLHSARYPRKPRGVPREVLGEGYEYRFSFCCAVDGCRRRCTPPSVRFLGRKVYLGTIVVLITALEHGLSDSRRRWLIESLDVPPQTLLRLRRWWQSQFALSRCWRSLRAQFVPQIDSHALPGSLLCRLNADDLATRICFMLLLLQPITSESCSRYLPVVFDPQKMC